MKKNKIINIIIIQFSIVFAFSSCSRQKIFQKTGLHLGTFINLTIITNSNDNAEKLFSGAFDEIKHVEDTMSPYKENSDVFRINKYASTKPVQITDETFSLLEKSLEISRDTGGAFDITFASLSHLWKFKELNFKPPDKNTVNQYIKLVNYKNIFLDEKFKTVRFLKNGVKTGLGGIAKGYAIYKAIIYLKHMGITAAIVEAGGDLQVLGDKFGTNWNAGLVHPRNKNILLSISLKDMEAIATSGDYEKFIIYKNKRYHHIINPGTGFPAIGLSSVSIITKDPVLSDAYATALFVMGNDRAVSFLKKKKNMYAILIDLEMNIYASKELKERIFLLEDVNITWF